jgi:hypothetical protein
MPYSCGGKSSSGGYTVLFDWGATISGLRDDELKPVAEAQEQS